MKITSDNAPNTGLSDTNPVGLETYSSDGQLVGRIQEYLDEVSEDEADIESGLVDLVRRDGTSVGPKRVLIDGHGYVLQAQIAVPLSQLDIDWKGRRATLRLTLAQIESIPHRDPSNADLPTLNTGT